MEQQQWNSDGGNTVSDSRVQRVTQTDYNRIPGADGCWFHAVINNQMKYGMNFSQVRMPRDEDFSYSRKQNCETGSLYVFVVTRSFFSHLC